MYSLLLTLVQAILVREYITVPKYDCFLSSFFGTLFLPMIGGSVLFRLVIFRKHMSFDAYQTNTILFEEDIASPKAPSLGVASKDSGLSNWTRNTETTKKSKLSFSETRKGFTARNVYIANAVVFGIFILRIVVGFIVYPEQYNLCGKKSFCPYMCIHTMTPSTQQTPLYTSHTSNRVAVGCNGDTATFLILGIYTVSVSICGVYYSYTISKTTKKDPHLILWEIKWGVRCMAIGGILALGLRLIDPGGLAKDGAFTYYFFSIIGVTCAFTFSFPVQLYHIYFPKQHVELNSREKLEDLLGSEEGVRVLQKQLQDEFSAEVLKFYLGANQWKMEYHDAEREGRVLSRNGRGMRIFNAFVPLDSFMSINISHNTRETILAIAAKCKLQETDLPQDIFNEAIVTMFKTMYRDTVPRLVQTQEYKGWVAMS